jgi:hypothetical protein
MPRRNQVAIEFLLLIAVSGAPSAPPSSSGQTAAGAAWFRRCAALLLACTAGSPPSRKHPVARGCSRVFGGGCFLPLRHDGLSLRFPQY